MGRFYGFREFSAGDPEGLQVQWGALDGDFPMHGHDFLELFLVSAGTAVHVIDGKRFPIQVGSVFTVQRGSEHAFIDIKQLQLWNIMIAEDYHPLVDKGLRLLPGYQALFVIDPVLPPEDRSGPTLILDMASLSYAESLLKELSREMVLRRAGWQIASRAGFYLLAVHLGRSYSAFARDAKNSDNHAFGIARTLAFIERNYTRQIHVHELARHVGLSERHYSRLFNTTYGVPPIAYIAKLRLNRARDLIENEHLSINEVAEIAGFSDSAHLCREFSRAFGCSPARFRKARMLSLPPGYP